MNPILILIESSNVSLNKYLAQLNHNSIKDNGDGDMPALETVFNQIGTTYLKQGYDRDSKAEVFHQSLQKDFGILNPKIAILSLNPHSGENGKIGTEEIEVQIPAINELRTKNILAFGPFPTDGFFGSSAPSKYDGVLAMYHDQGLPVLKYSGFGSAVNITLGLPFIRTSVDHGTALDLAGSGGADAGSFRAAMANAAELIKRSHAAA